MVDNERLRCASCEGEISGRLVLVDGGSFCCPGCARGGPCTCTYEDDQGYRRNGHCDLDSGDLRFDYGSRQVTVRGQPVRLTPTEYSLLFHLTRSAGRVVSHHTLLTKVWGRGYAEEMEYLKVYVRRLRQKLEGDPETVGRIVSERGVGYMFVAA